jgi:hypothetical protein
VRNRKGHIARKRRLEQLKDTSVLRLLGFILKPLGLLLNPLTGVSYPFHKNFRVRSKTIRKGIQRQYIFFVSMV